MKLTGFSKVSKNKKFNYQPVFYKPDKEEFEERVKNLERKYGKKVGEEKQNNTYTNSLRGQMKGYLFKSERSPRKFSFVRMVILAFSLILAIAIVMLMLKILATTSFFNVFTS